MAAALGRLVARRLPDFLSAQRWFGAKGRVVSRVALRDAGPLAETPAAPWLALAEVSFSAGPPELYALPLTLTSGERAGARLVGVLDDPPLRVYDALDDPDACLALLAGFEGAATLATRRGAIRFRATRALAALATPPPTAVRRVTTEQSNTSVIYDSRLILKAFRKLEAGVNPDGEVTGFLTSETGYGHVPRLAGTLEYTGEDGFTATLGLLQEFVRSEGDGWSHVVARLGHLADSLWTEAVAGDPAPGRREAFLREAAVDIFRDVRRLGEVTGSLHAALASARPGTPFAPEPITIVDVQGWARDMAAQVGPTLSALRGQVGRLDPAVRPAAAALLGRALDLAPPLAALSALTASGCAKTRVHGDYHLGQTLKTADGFAILDFEGEPARPLAERRAKQSPLRDVAGMLRSLDYAAAAGLTRGDADEAQRLEPWRVAWVGLARAAFLDGYRTEAGRAPVRLGPPPDDAFVAAVRAYELDKALYEVRYELGSRPAWLAIPLRGLARLLGSLPA